MTTDFWDVRLFLGYASVVAGVLALIHGTTNSRQATTGFPNQEIKLRLFLGYISLIVGTLALLHGIIVAPADGEPFHYPRNNLVFWSMPSLVASIYLYIGRNVRFLSWALTLFLIFWAFSTLADYIGGRIKFHYWHQGDVFCPACDNSFATLFLASVSFGFCALVVAVTNTGRGRGAELSTGRFLIGVATLLPLFLSVLFFGLS
jgi:hypothetical protein